MSPARIKKPIGKSSIVYDYALLNLPHQYVYVNVAYSFTGAAQFILYSLSQTIDHSVESFRNF
jgi:hypothetical protein